MLTGETRSGDRDRGGEVEGYLVIAEHRRWWVSACYD
jgi:hypothetical protein